MKTRRDFVTNSSSTSFLIENTTSEDLGLVDLIKELENQINKYFEGSEEITYEKVLKSAYQNNDYYFLPHIPVECVFSDGNGIFVECILRTILLFYRSTSSFKWNVVDHF